MRLGIPKEIKNNESRIAVTPDVAKVYVDAGIELYIENNAGINCGFSNEDFESAGAIICDQATVWECEVILKVKEPQVLEYPLFKENQIIWGFLHLAANPECVKIMQEKNITAIASETIKKDNQFNLLRPVSVIAGRRSVFTGLNYLEFQHGGKGILLPGISDETSGKVLIFGGGVVGENAAMMAHAIGCQVTIIENNKQRQLQLLAMFNNEIEVFDYTPEILEAEMIKTDLLISTILIPGSKPPKLVKEYMVKQMRPGSVIVDVSIDQGGCVETIDNYTTHEDPILIKYGILHYAVPNMPGAVPVTASYAIQGVAEYILEAHKDIENIFINEDIKAGIQVHAGEVVNENLKKSLCEI